MTFRVDVILICAMPFGNMRVGAAGAEMLSSGPARSQDDARFLIAGASLADVGLLRAAFAVARRSRASGRHPFGAVLAGPGGEVLLEQGNGFDPGVR